MAIGGCSGTSIDAPACRPASRVRDAVVDVLGREPTDGEVFAVLPRSEWRLGLGQ